MPAPNLKFSISGNLKISAVSGHDSISVTFESDVPYKVFECRATRAEAEWGLGKGTLLASFSQTPAHIKRTFEIYDDLLVSGDGEYRISLYAQSYGANFQFPFENPSLMMKELVFADESWNDK